MVSLTYTDALSPSQIHHFSAWSYRQDKTVPGPGPGGHQGRSHAVVVKCSGCQVNRSDLGNG